MLKFQILERADFIRGWSFYRSDVENIFLHCEESCKQTINLQSLFLEVILEEYWVKLVSLLTIFWYKTKNPLGRSWYVKTFGLNRNSKPDLKLRQVDEIW